MALELLSNLISPRHIVIIDDDENIRRIFSDILEKKKYEVTSAACWEALGDPEELDEVDLFILDLFIKPGPDGPAIAKQLRKLDFDCAILFVSAKHVSLKEEGQLTAIMEDVHFLQKPVSPVALLHKVAELTR